MMKELENTVIGVIPPENIEKCRHVILPAIYEELEGASFDGVSYNERYMVLAAAEDDRYAGALVMELDEFGTMNLVSLFVLSDYRRKGIATALMQQSLALASYLFVWPEEDDIIYEMEQTIYEMRQYAKENDIDDLSYIEAEEADLRETCDEILASLSRGEFTACLDTDYCLPPGMFSIWESFLKAAGFTEFERLPDETVDGKLYYAGSASCDVVFEKNDNRIQ